MGGGAVSRAAGGSLIWQARQRKGWHGPGQHHQQRHAGHNNLHKEACGGDFNRAHLLEVEQLVLPDLGGGGLVLHPRAGLTHLHIGAAAWKCGMQD